MSDKFQTMKNRGFLLLLLAFLFLGISATVAQPTIYSESLTSEDAVILQKHDQINIIGKKLGFIFYEFTRKIRIKIVNENGVKAFSTYTLPETYDPTYISQAPKVRNDGGYYLTRLNIPGFKVTIHNSAGDNVLQLTPVEREMKCVTTRNKYGSLYEYDYSIPGLKIGDEVEIEYTFSVPFDENLKKLLSFRLFPHDYYDVQDYSLKVIHDKDLMVDLAFHNGFNPDSSKVVEGNKIITWHKTDLKGCLGEANGRPFKTLPYMVFSIKPSEISYFVPNTFTSKSLPGYFIPVSFREEHFQPIIQNMMNNVMLRDYPALHNFVKKNLGETVTDTIGYLQLDRLHSIIVDRFKYDDNSKYFNDLYNSDPLLGKSVGAEIIQEVSRYDFYCAWISKTGQFFYSAYLTDVRSGEIDEKYYAPMFSDDFLLAVQFKSGKVVFLYPKRDNFGYYIDEVPFYFEKALTRLVCIEDYSDARYPINEDFRHIKTPGSSWADNSRKTNVQVNVNAGGTSAVMTGNVTLLGQFSTMTRGSYLNNYKDATVNPLYSHKIWDVSSQTKLLSSNVEIQQKNFPFKTTVKASYEVPGLVTPAADSTYVISLANLFPHIISSGLNENRRSLDFYSDFQGQDMFTYYFVFADNVEIVKNIENVSISNAFGGLIIEAVQADSNSLRITSCLNIRADKASAENILTVSQLFNAIDALNRSTITFKKVR